jgi:GT2 family glycosyltransferase
MTNPRKLIVLILSYNGKNLLNDSITSFLKNSYSNFKVAVIDNGSTDGTKEYVELNFPAVKVLRTNINLKYSGGLNFGLRHAFEEQMADYALITNNDVIADENLIQSLVNIAQTDEKAGFVIGKVYYYSKPQIFQTVGKRYDPILWNGGHIGHGEKDIGQYENIEERAWCDDIYWLVKRELYDITGGYDTEFAFQGEDFDWQVRAKQAGYKIIYTPYAKLWHKESMTIGKTSPFKAYYDARNPLIVHMKYRSPDEFRKFFHIRLRSILKGSIKQLLKLRFRHSCANLTGLASAIHWGIKNKKLTLRHFV